MGEEVEAAVEAAVATAVGEEYIVADNQGAVGRALTVAKDLGLAAAKADARS